MALLLTYGKVDANSQLLVVSFQLRCPFGVVVRHISSISIIREKLNQNFHFELSLSLLSNVCRLTIDNCKLTADIKTPYTHLKS